MKARQTLASVQRRSRMIGVVAYEAVEGDVDMARRCSSSQMRRVRRVILPKVRSATQRGGKTPRRFGELNLVQYPCLRID